MKNKMKLFGIIAIAAVIGFSMAACDDNSSNSVGGPTNLGDTPTLSGKVYVEKWVEDNDDWSFDGYEDYAGDALEVSVSGWGGSFSGGGGGMGPGGDSRGPGLNEKGIIENGQFSFTLGTPKSKYLDSADDMKKELFYYYENVNISPSSAKFFIINSLKIDSSGYYRLSRENTKVNYSGTSMSGTKEGVSYVYADKDCTISGKGFTDSWEYEDDEDGVIYTNTLISKNLNLALKAGWNAVYHKWTEVDTPTKYTETITISLGNLSSLKWVLID
ncbi:MAG: hypothetical protein LBH43_02035 [Treponema sp.]|jgi:hypothetical protein|nr:hypothetical protein [Treponema sp.]